MKLQLIAPFKLVATLLSPFNAAAQQAGTLESEQKPTITLKECTLSGGCTSRQAKLTLDANWRWIHETDGFQNCYTGNQWDAGRCSDPVQCAQNCALEGVSQQKYEHTYGIKQVQDGVRLNFVTQHQYGTNVGSRLYVMEDDDNYAMFYLKNREFSFEVDVSELYCGMNGAMYFTEMQANGGKGVGNNDAGARYGTGYCDAQCPRDIKFIDGEANVLDWAPNPNDRSNNMGAGKYGACCAEMDIWEANSMASAFTPHTCSTNKLHRCSDPVECGDNASGHRYDGVCDKDGCDINPYRMGVEDFYGRGDRHAVNTLKPMTVVTQFLTTDGTDEGDFSEMRRLYIQDGRIIHSPPSTILGPGKESDSITDQFCDDKKDLFGDVKHYQEHGGMKGMGESLDRGHAMIFSLWDDVEVNMLWLDSSYPLDRPPTDPGIKRGDCPGGTTSTPTYLRQNYPNGGVIFKNAAVGEIGSTYESPPTAPTAPTPEPTETPISKPTESAAPTASVGCLSNNYKNCLPNLDSNELKSCHTVWLPNGPQANCFALWEECTGQGSSSCCGDAECFGDATSAVCVPPVNPTESPTSSLSTAQPAVPSPPAMPPPVSGPTCLAQWQDCTYDWRNCCEGYKCKQINVAGYGRCLADTCRKPPTMAPTAVMLSDSPTEDSSISPSEVPTDSPTENPSGCPTEVPTDSPTEDPSASPSAVPTVLPSEEPVMNTKYYAVCGKGSGCSDGDILEASVTEDYAVRCCSDRFLEGWKKRSNCDVWALSEVGGMCHQTSFAAAVGHCMDAGARLCKQEELSGQCARGTGCSFDSRLVWSSSPVLSGHYVVCGKGNGCTGGDAVVASDDQLHEVRCCSDASIPGWKKRTGCDVWAASKINGTCHHDKSHSEAQDTCADAGISTRLCTKSELQAECARGTGCGHDSDLIWSSTEE